MSRVRPLGDRVLIQPLAPGETIGTIHVPEIARQVQDAQLGKVLAVGPGFKISRTKRSKMTIKAGDTVVMTKYRGSLHFSFEGQDLCILSERDVLAIT